MELEGFEIYANNYEDNTYKMDWYQNSVLLVNKDIEVSDFDHKDLYGERYNPGINNGRAYFEIESKKFYKMKCIEIINP